jgi:hypothetical protein
MTEVVKEQILKALVQESEKSFGFTSAKLEGVHVQLHRYSYKYAMGVKETETQSSKQKLESTKVLGSKALQSLSLENSGVKIKLENRMLLDVKAATTTLISAKNMLEKQESMLKDVQLSVATRSEKDELWKNTNEA